jgi:hypothetical protein
MIKATGRGQNGKSLLVIGLSFANLDRLRAGPLDDYIPIDGAELGLSHDILIISGRTEADMADLVSQALTPDAKVHVDPRLKS